MSTHTVHIVRRSPFTGDFFVEAWSLTWDGRRYHVAHQVDGPAASSAEDAIEGAARRYGRRPVLELTSTDRRPTIEELERTISQ